LAGCDGEEEPLPTPLDPEQAMHDAGLLTEAEHNATLTANVPTETATATLTPTITETPTPIPSETPTATNTGTLSPIRQTEVYIAARRTQEIEIATANAPTLTATFTPSLTPSRTIDPSVSQTPTLVIENRRVPNRIVFSSDRAGSNDIWLMELDGSNPFPLVLYPDSQESTASCSPSGQQFVFDSDRKGDREIYLGDYQGSEPRPLTDTDGENFAPAWSPIDPDVIAFLSSREGQTSIWLMDSGGGNVRRLTQTAGEYTTPQWSPDGSKLYYAARHAEHFDLFAYDFTINEEQQITTTPDLDESAPTLDYDLSTLAFIANLHPDDPNTGALWVTDFFNPAKPVVTAQGRVDSPQWIDNGQLLLSADLGGVTHILLVDLINTKQAILTNVGPVNQSPRSCFIETDQEGAPLPTGIAPTPTPSITPELITVYTAVVNPGAGWQTIEAIWTLDQLAALAPNDYRLGIAVPEIRQDGVDFRWVNANQDIHLLSVALEALDGALEPRILSYTVNALPADLSAVQDLPFVIRENLLLGSIPPGVYRLAAIDFATQEIRFTFQIPQE
jgi:TolB protein